MPFFAGDYEWPAFLKRGPDQLLLLDETAFLIAACMADLTRFISVTGTGFVGCTWALAAGPASTKKDKVMGKRSKDGTLLLFISVFYILFLKLQFLWTFLALIIVAVLALRAARCAPLSAPLRRSAPPGRSGPAPRNARTNLRDRRQSLPPCR